MKRAGNLIHQIADPENLRIAFWKAQQGKSGKREVIGFSDHLDQTLLVLREQIISGEVKIGNYHYFTIHDPKERTICAASFPERVLHHALMNICHHVFEKYQIFDSYASRTGKGTYAALDRAKYFQKKYQWFLKLDVRKYFDSINHEILNKILSSRFKDKVLVGIFNKIINSYETSPLKGLPIGNLTSQYFANHYLAVADHFIKERLKIKCYVRYMDDMVLWHNDKERLINTRDEIYLFLRKELKLTLKPDCLNKTSTGLPFLGYRIFSDHLRLSKRSKTRYKQKIEKYCECLDQGRFSQSCFQDHILPMIAFTEHARALKFRKKNLEKIYGQWPWALTA